MNRIRNAFAAVSAVLALYCRLLRTLPTRLQLLRPKVLREVLRVQFEAGRKEGWEAGWQKGFPAGYAKMKENLLPNHRLKYPSLFSNSPSVKDSANAAAGQEEMVRKAEARTRENVSAYVERTAERITSEGSADVS